MAEEEVQVGNPTGKIHSIACKNFVTYTDVVVSPGQFLNVVLGPNGSGKSTIVAAIILGLGGNPKTLSRSSQIEDYVKNGKSEAWIEIQLYKNEDLEIEIFERTINLEGKSTWKIDKVFKKIKEYTAAVAQYNIQIDNLCQFLPQDRVQDFAKMDSREILYNTMSSICSQEILGQFQMLKQLRQQKLSSIKKIEQNRTRLEECKNINLQFKEKIKTMNYRKTILHDKNICEIKLLWLKYQNETNECDEAHNQVNEAIRNFNRAKEYYEDIKKNSINVIKKSEKLQTEIDNEEIKNRQCTKVYAEFTEKSDKLEESIKEAEAYFKNKETEFNEKNNDVLNEKRILRALEQDLKNANNDLDPDYDTAIENIEKQLMIFKENFKSLQNQHTAICREMEDQVIPEKQLLERKIASLEDVGERKLKVLRDKFDDVYRGVNWLRQNLNLFEGKIYEPMLLELNVQNSKYTKYIENTISERDLVAFTCENVSDMNILVTRLCTEQRLKINVLHSESSTEVHYKSPEPIQKYENLGFFSYAIDMVEGPAPILNYLCKIYGLHKILVGTEKVNNNIDSIPRNIELFFAGNYRYSIQFSKYSGDKSTMRNEINERNVLYVGVDVGGVNNQKKKLHELNLKYDALQNDRSDSESKLNNLEERRNVVLGEKKKKLQQKLTVLNKDEYVQLQKKKILRLQNQVIDLEQEELKLKNFARDVVKKLIIEQSKTLKNLKIFQESIYYYNIAYNRLQTFKKENSELEKSASNAKEAVKNAKKIVETILKNYESLKLKLEEKLIEIKNRSDGTHPKDKRFKFKKEFSVIPNNIPELVEFLRDLQCKVNCVTDENQLVLMEYEQRCAEINQIEEEIKNEGALDGKTELDIVAIHNKWHPSIKQIVETINKNFHKFMQSMSYIGEVRLAYTNEHDYDSYGIEILVQYRPNSKLQALDRYVQSGGERAVAIAVYTLSLQCILRVPFRCVDEINQGMDPRNERKFYEMLIEETSDPNQSQYFFITPKLLTKLPYNDSMTCLIVFSGNYVEI